jgi:molybdopterin synthase catalytic subunit
LENVLKSKIILFAKLKEIIGTSQLELDLFEGAKVSDLKIELIQKFPHLNDYLQIMLVSINQNFAFDSDTIPDNAEIALFPPVSGGAMDAADFFDVTKDEFEFNSLINQVIENQTGAIVMFTGVIRGETKNTMHPKTSGLEYEAYIPMAKTKMAQVADEIRSKWPTIQKIIIIQRIGYMDAKTPTVVVMCTAAHRNTGVFEAAQYGIDRVKEIVPIWKKEISPDGQTWIEGDYIPEKGD